MERPASQEEAQRPTPALWVWKSLTEDQKAAVLRAVLQVCQEFVSPKPDEVQHDPTCASA